MKATFAQWSHALAIVESSNEANPPLGDGGRAAFRWQMHPSFVAQWYRPPFGSDDTWDEACSRALTAFYTTAVKIGADDVVAAVGFHLHGQPHASAADMAGGDGAHYATKFRAALGTASGV